WVRPSGGYISSHFSTWRPACNNGYCATEHTGTDLAAGYGTPIVAATSGTVELGGWTSWGGGNMVWINHAGGFQTRYAHMSEIYVGAGQSVQAGQVIGLVGATGNANGPHLHFETLIGGVFVDPYYFMGDRGVWF
ncbi:M23 family metallopeptidase, partial [Leucobacter sp. M11]|uniref:M23 family metallopeptidase n=1 Tax=Leucobacter sp. M11 TaxID=2993565 RepID=UPI002D80BCA6